MLVSAVSAVFDDLAFNARVFARGLFVTAALLAGLFGSMVVGIAVANSADPDVASAGPETTSVDAPPPSHAPGSTLPTDGVSYMNTVEGKPLTVDCGVPVVIRYDANGAPYNADDVIRTASNLYSTSIGRPIIFEYGHVDFNEASSGSDFTIGIGWTGSLPSNDERTDVLGQGGPIMSGATVIGGHVSLAADTAWPAAGASPGSELGVVLHELGHVAGLDHAAGGQMEAEADDTRPPGFSASEAAALRWIFTSTCPNPNGT